MIKKFINLSKNTFIYSVANVINSAIPIFLIPILTRYLSPSSYGKLSMFQVLIAVFIPIIGMSTNGAIGVKYFKLTNAEYSKFVTSCIYLIYASFFIILSLIVGFSNIIYEYTQIIIEFQVLALLTVFFQVIINILLVDFQVKSKVFKYGYLIIANTLVNIVISIILVVFLSYDWIGRVFGQFISVFIFGFLSIVLLARNKVFIGKFFFNYIKSAFKFGIVLIPNYVMGVFSVMLGRIIINNEISLEETGLYTLGYQIASLLLILFTSFNLAFSPWLFEKLKLENKSTKINIVRFTYIIFIVLLIIPFIYEQIIDYFYPLIVSKDFNGAKLYVFWISFGFIFNSMHMLVVNYIFYVEKVYFVTLITVPSLILNYFLTLYFIEIFGGIGAAYSQSITSFVSFLGVWLISTKVYKMPWFSSSVFLRHKNI
ncbi:MAG: oligosaccharide flippase family protein [Bacteroidetes bacterium]|nr:oligosaccharide flippase family protein [Bacteroidota bacterium]